MGRVKRHVARKSFLQGSVEYTMLVTKWDENKYVIVAIDNGHETSTITKRLMKNIESEIEGDLLSITLLFGAISSRRKNV